VPRNCRSRSKSGPLGPPTLDGGVGILPIARELRLADCCGTAAVMPSVESDLAIPPNGIERSSRPWQVYPTLAIALVICGWFISWGDWKFFEHDALASYYDAQALSMLNGRLDVPREAIGFEAYIYNGKAYGYFGIAPALLRIPLLIVFPTLDGLWSRPMMMLACVVALVCVYFILRELRAGNNRTDGFQNLIDNLFLLTAAIGSTNVFIIARSYVFHEAIMWGCTFALVFSWALLKYLRSPNRAWLIVSGVLAFLSFHSRATAGAGTLLALCAVLLLLIGRTLGISNAGVRFLGFGPTPRPLLHATVAAIAVMATLGTYAGVNYAKFRTLGSMPLHYYQLYIQAPARMEVTGARQIHPENIPTTLATYFGPNGFEFRRAFPWAHLASIATVIGSPSIDVVEPFSTVPASMPALTLLALVGCVPLLRGSTESVRRLRLPATAMLVGGGVVLMTVGITERYLHDFYPALIILAAIGVFEIGRNASAAHARVSAMLLIPLTLVSIWLNCSFALLNQRDGPWGVPPEKHAEFLRWQQ
jgi:hypothetical protein